MNYRLDLYCDSSVCETFNALPFGLSSHGYVRRPKEGCYYLDYAIAELSKYISFPGLACPTYPWSFRTW
jgi:hypothetical protein